MLGASTPSSSAPPAPRKRIRQQPRTRINGIRPHRRRTVLSNAQRSPSELSITNTRINVDVGASLQDLLQSSDDGKRCTQIDSHSPDGVPCWREQVIRIYFQNINGLSVNMDGADILDAMFHMENIRADVFAWVETKLDCQKSSVRSLLHAQKRKIWDHCKLVSSSSNLPWPTTYKPGGTLLGVTGPLAGRVREVITDDMGRWSGVELLGRDGRNVVVLCAYQVCQLKNDKKARTTSYQQQVTLLRLKGLHPDPRKHFINDLSVLVADIHKKGSDLILMGDFNEEIGLTGDGMAKVVGKGRLTDIQAYCHGIECEAPTYARGKKRLDYVFASSQMLTHVMRQGCEPFNFRIFSDHRGLFVDFSYPGFFDRSPNVLVSPSNRGVIYNCPKHVQKYLEYMNNYLSEHDIVHRYAELSEMRDDALAEALDAEAMIGYLKADEICKNFNRSPWSEALHIAMTTKSILLRHLSQFKTGLDMKNTIDIAQAKLPQPVPLPDTFAATNAALRLAQKQCRLVVKQARDLKKSYQTARIDAKRLANPSKDPEKVQKEIQFQDATKEMWRQIPSSKPHSSGGISMIKIPIDPNADPKDKATVFRTIVEPTDLEARILNRNCTHFAQAIRNPLADAALTEKIGWGGTKLIVSHIFDGTVDLSTLSPDAHSQSIFRLCSPPKPELPAAVSLVQLKSSYRTWPVNTSTSPSQRHLGHQHVLFQPHGIPDDDVHKEQSVVADATRDLLWNIQHATVDYATKHGYCFNRWRQVVNAMIEKDVGDPKLHRLRVIHLYESDYNLILGVKFREVVRSAEDDNSLNIGCYGSRASRSSLDPVFLELLQYDYALLTRFDEVIFANDAGSCYDRIIVSVSNVVSRSFGLHRNIADIHGSMLEKPVYRIKTQLGISKGSYSHSVESPVFGTGQGSCSSPPIWLLGCSRYFDIYDSQSYGSSYCDPSRQHSIRLGMVGFVDDNRVQVNCHPRDRSSLMDKASHDGQLWSDILWSSGGILEHDKCSYHYLRSDFDRNGAPVLRGGLHGAPIIIKDSDGVPTNLKQISTYTSYKTLGTYQSPGSKQMAQYNTLLTVERMTDRGTRK